MATELNWTAFINFQLANGAAEGLRRDAQRYLSGINADVNLRVNPQSQSALNGLSTSTTNLSSRLRTLAADEAAAKAATTSMTASVSASANAFEDFGHRVDLASRRFLAFAAGAGSFIAVARALREGLSAASEFESQLTKLDQIGGLTQSQIRAIGDEAGRLGTTFGSSSRGLSEAAVALRLAGQSAEQVTASLGAVSKAALVPGFGDLHQTTQRATELFREFGIAGRELEATFSGVNAVSKQFGVESGDVLSGITRAGSAFRQAGGSATELAAIVASLRKETGDSGEAIGGSLRQIFQRFQRPASIASLRDLGVELTHTREEALALGQANLEGTFVGPLTAVQRLGQALAQLRTNDPRVADISESLGVPRGASRVVSALQQRESIQRAVNAAQYAELDLDGQAEKAQGTLANQTAQLKEQFLQLGRAIFADDGFRALASDVLKVSSAAVTLADNLRPLLPLATSLLALKVGSGLGSLFNGFRGPAQPRLAIGGPVPGFAQGGHVNAMVMPGEAIFSPDQVRQIGVNRLHNLNDYGHVSLVPGTGNTDSVHASLPFGSFVLRKRVAQHLAQGGVVGAEQHPFGNFDPADFGGFVGSVRAEAAKLQVALSAATSVFVEFAEAGPIFRGFAQVAKDAAAQIRQPRERLSLRDEAYQAELAKELVGTKASRAKLVEKGFLAEDAATAVSAPAERPLTKAQIQSRVDRAERENRLQALASFYASKEHLWDTVDVDPADLVPPTPFARRQSSPSSATIASSSRALVPYVSRSVVPYSAPPDVVDAEFYVHPPLLEDRRRRRYSVGDDVAAQQFQGRALARAQGRDRFDEVNADIRSRQEADDALRANRARTSGITDPLAYRASLRGQGVTLAAELADVATTRRDNRVPSFDELHPDEAAYQRTALSQVHSQSRAEEFRRRIEEREQKRANRIGDQVHDPLERRQLLRGVGYSLDDELGDQATQLRAARRVRRPEYASSSLDELAQSRADTEVGRRGGPDLISLKTKEAILAQQRQGVEQELVAVTARQLSVLRPGIAKQEALNIAAEQLAQATAENAKVLRDNRGRVLGLAANVASLPDGVRPDVRSRLGGYISGKFPSLERFGGLGNIGFFGASVAGSYAAAGLDNLAGSAADSVAGGSEGRFRGFRAGGSALQGALLGGAVGSAVLPGWGTAIGAAVGALHGFTSGLAESTKAIQEVRIANATSDLGENLKAISIPGADFATFQSARKNLGTIRSEQTERNRSQATSLFGNLDVEEFAGLQRKGQRDALGGQLPQIGSYLSRQAEELGKSNLGVQAKELSERLRDGGNGLNREFLTVIAGIRGVSLDSVLQGFKKDILENQKSFRNQQEAQKVQSEQDKTLNAFGRLTQAAELAAAGLIQLQSQSHSIGDVFAGRVSATPVGGLSELLSHPGNPNRGEYLSALGGATSLLGPGGVRLRQTGEAASNIERVLPSVLAQVLGQNPLDESDFSSRTRSLTRSALGYREQDKLPDQVGRGLDSVVSGLNQKKLADIIREAGNDVTGLSKKLVESFGGPVQDASVRIGRELEKNANLFISELVSATQRASQIREATGRLDSVRLGAERQEAIFRAQEIGRPSQALDLLSLDQLQRPYQQRQERLVGVQGPAALDPGFIAERLREAREQIGPATQRQADAARRFGGGPQVDAASTELVRLKDRAASLQEALSHLANATDRNASLQEKLASLQSDKEGRVGFLRSYITASPEERIQKERGLVLANQANNLGSIRGFTPDDQRQIVNTLDSLNGTKLSGFANGPAGPQPIARDLSEALLKEFGGQNVAQDAGNRVAEVDLKRSVIENNKAAVDAQKALLANLGELNKDAAATTKQLQAEFLSRLEGLFAKDALTDRTIKQARVGADLGSLRGLTTHRDVLARVGVTDDIGVERLRGASVDIEALAAGKKKGVEARDRIGEAIAPERIEQLYQQAYAGIEDHGVKFRLFEQSAFDSKSRASLADTLGDPGKGFGFAAPDVAKILTRYEQLGKESVDREHRGALTPAGALIGDNKDLLKQSLRSAILTVGEEAARRDGSDAVNAARQRLSGRGIDVGRVERVIGDDGAGVGQLVKAAGAFGPDNRLSTLDDRLAKTVAEFDGLGASIRNLRAALAEAAGPRLAVGAAAGIFANARGLATGGTVAHNGVPGGPRGTDTVPAWLTPGEFVLQKHVYERHRDLVHAMHRGDVSQHLADGGQVKEKDRGLEIANQIAAARKRLDAEKAAKDAAAGDKDLGRRIERELQAAALANPASGAGQYLFANKFGADKKGFQDAVTRNYYAQQVAGVTRRQRIAQLGDPLAAFGRGRPGIEAQRAIAGRQAIFAVNPQDLQAGGHSGIETKPVWQQQADALRRGRQALLQGQQLAFGVAADPAAVRAPVVPAAAPPGLPGDHPAKGLFPARADLGGDHPGNAIVAAGDAPQPPPPPVAIRPDPVPAPPRRRPRFWLDNDANKFGVPKRDEDDIPEGADRPDGGSNVRIVPRKPGEPSLIERREEIQRRAKERELFVGDSPKNFDPIPGGFTEIEPGDNRLPPPRWVFRDTVLPDSPGISRTGDGNVRIQPQPGRKSLIEQRHEREIAEGHFFDQFNLEVDARNPAIVDARKKAAAAKQPSWEEQQVAARERLRQFDERQRAANAERDEAAKAGLTLRQFRERKAQLAAAGDEADHKADGGEVFDLNNPLGRRNRPFSTAVTGLPNFRVSASKDQMNGSTNDSGPSFAVPAVLGAIPRGINLAARAKRYAEGGLATGGNGNGDDIAAYLSRGEFVLNQRATQAIGVGNLDRMNYFARGGIVRPQFFAEGGLAGASPAGGGGGGIGPVGMSPETLAALASFNSGSSLLGKSLTDFGAAASSFGSKVDRFGEFTKQIPSSIDLKNQSKVEVIINGAEVMGRLMPALQEYVTQQIDAALRKSFKDRIPEA